MLEALSSKFKLGQVLMTPGAQEALSPDEVLIFLKRHGQADWGDLCNEDKNTNNLALRHGGRLFSVYHTSAGEKIYLITDEDYLHSTFLLPSEY
jgi:hypothetical protein